MLIRLFATGTLANDYHFCRVQFGGPLHIRRDNEPRLCDTQTYKVHPKQVIKEIDTKRVCGSCFRILTKTLVDQAVATRNERFGWEVIASQTGTR